VWVLVAFTSYCGGGTLQSTLPSLVSLSLSFALVSQHASIQLWISRAHELKRSKEVCFLAFIARQLYSSTETIRSKVSGKSKWLVGHSGYCYMGCCHTSQQTLGAQSTFTFCESSLWLGL